MRLIAALLGAAVLALGTVVGVMYLDLRSLREGRAAGQEAMAAARAVAPDLLSYNHSTIEQDLARAQSHTTGDLTRHYRELSRTLVPRAREQKTVQQAAVAGSAVEKATPERVEVLVFLNMGTVKESPDTTDPKQQVSQNRARFVMVKIGPRWLVAELSTLLGAV